jgi:hypothetical protein
MDNCDHEIMVLFARHLHFQQLSSFCFSIFLKKTTKTKKTPQNNKPQKKLLRSERHFLGLIGLASSRA